MWLVATHLKTDWRCARCFRCVNGVLTKTEDASNTLFSERYQQTYHSTFGALTESMHVFLHGAYVVHRLSAGQPTRVLEIGLGLGLNCLLAADHATSHNTQLDYTAIEHDPITAPQFRALNYQKLLQTPALVDDLAQLLSAPDSPASKDNRVNSDSPINPNNHTRLAKLGEHTNVELHIGDATSEALLDNLAADQPYNAIFLDAFSPEHNPECWTLAFFERLYGLLAADGFLATYCVKGTVRRNLQAAGFTVHKYPGPAGKREVLRASK